MSKNKIFSFKNLIRYFLVIIFFTQNFYPIFSQDIVIEAQSSWSSSWILSFEASIGSENSSEIKNTEQISSSLESSNIENLQSSSMQLSSEIIKSESSDASSTNIVSEISSINNYDSSQIYIPAYQAVGNYTWTLVYTLYEPYTP